MKGPGFYIVTAVYLAALISLCWFIPRDQFSVSLMAYLTMLVGMWMVALGDASVNQILTLGIISRIVAVFAVPELSDDIYRFVWDGLVSSNGINPYEFTPSEVIHMGDGDLVPGSKALFPLLNSPDYHTVYPPVIQALNLSSVWISGGNIYGSIVYLKLAVALADISSLLILVKILDLMDIKQTMFLTLLALNPLMITEISANGHHEGFILLLLLSAIYSLLRSRYLTGGLLLGVAIGIKLTPLILIPVMTAHLIKKGGAVRFISGTMISSGILLSPIADPVIRNAMTESTGLYFNTFAFNSPLFHFTDRASKFFEQPWQLMDIAGHVFPFVSILVIMTISVLVYKGKLGLLNGVLWTMACYLLLSRVIHPWYLVPLSGIAVIGRNLPLILWGNLAFLSYSAYTGEPYRESMILLTTQYLILFLLLLFSRKLQLSPSEVHSESQ
jgi:hypothetical protein